MGAYCLSGLVSGSTFSQYFLGRAEAFGSLLDRVSGSCITFLSQHEERWGCLVWFGFFLTHAALLVQIPLKRYLGLMVVHLKKSNTSLVKLHQAIFLHP